MNELLKSYLPSYYQESRQMNAIMDLVASHMPDVDRDLWKAFFVKMLSPKSIDLWKTEYGVKTEEELLALLSSSGTLSVESLQLKGLSVFETFRAMPEDGVTLSESGVLADGKEYMPLTTIIKTVLEDQPDFAHERAVDTHSFAKGLVKLMGLAGFQYLFALALKMKAYAPRGQVHQSNRLHVGFEFPSRLDEELSGPAVTRQAAHAVHCYQSARLKRQAWWSPNVFFTDPHTFVTEEFSVQQSTIKRSGGAP
ncbi:UNVERIFIED_CONTAM: hypothetical protein ABID98_004836 [Brevibacillus sp. OAP136]